MGVAQPGIFQGFANSLSIEKSIGNNRQSIENFTNKNQSAEKINFQFLPLSLFILYDSRIEFQMHNIWHSVFLEPKKAIKFHLWNVKQYPNYFASSVFKILLMHNRKSNVTQKTLFTSQKAFHIVCSKVPYMIQSFLVSSFFTIFKLLCLTLAVPQVTRSEFKIEKQVRVSSDVVTNMYSKPCTNKNIIHKMCKSQSGAPVSRSVAHRYAIFLCSQDVEL